MRSKKEQENEMKLKEKVSWIMGRVQRSLFPLLEDCCYLPLTNKEKHLIEILEIVEIERHILDDWNRYGRPRVERKVLGRCFVAKAVLRYATTTDLINNLKSNPNLRTICGFKSVSKIPSEATFSRSFSEFAKIDLGGNNLDHLVEKYLSQELVGHINRDSTAIKGREKIVKKKTVPKMEKAKRGRPRKGSARRISKKTRLQIQLNQTAEQSIAELPVTCDRGVKKNAKGYIEAWNGFKLHADVNELGLPLSIVLTSASVHDSQAAIPLIQATSNKVQYCYDVMDAAYDSFAIKEASVRYGHVPLIDPNKRRKKQKVQFFPHEKERYKERGAVERFFGRLKDEFGAKQVMVKGAEKVKLHLMFGVVAIFADQLTKINAS